MMIRSVVAGLLLLGTSLALADTTPTTTDEARALAATSTASTPMHEHAARTPSSTDEARAAMGARHDARAECPKACRCG